MSPVRNPAGQQIQQPSATAAIRKLKGKEALIIGQSDPAIQQAYFAFFDALDAGHLMFPEDAAANRYFEQLLREPELKPLHGMLKRKLVAALIDVAQRAPNGWLMSDLKEVESYGTQRGIEYLKFPAQLERAAGLLGERHYMYKDLKAKKAFFQARVLIMKTGGMTTGNWDSLRLAELYQYVREGLHYDDHAAYLHVKMSYYYFGKRNWEMARASMQQAIELAPSWIQAYSWLSNS